MMQFRPRTAIVFVAMALLMILSIVSVAFATTGAGGTGPGEALPLPGDWSTVNPGETQWYYFDYTRDRAASNDAVKALELKLWSDPKGAVLATVRSKEDAALWVRDGKQQWFGALTETILAKDYNNEGDDTAGKADYYSWKGQLLSSGRYYVVVQLERGRSAPAAWHIALIGNN